MSVLLDPAAAAVVTAAVVDDDTAGDVDTSTCAGAGKAAAVTVC